MAEKLMTLHPDPAKHGVNISRQKYEIVRQAILDALEARGALTYTGLAEEVEARIGADFEGSVRWYTETVKLDLEARAIIERIPGSKPQSLRKVGS